MEAESSSSSSAMPPLHEQEHAHEADSQEDGVDSYDSFVDEEDEDEDSLFGDDNDEKERRQFVEEQQAAVLQQHDQLMHAAASLSALAQSGPDIIMCSVCDEEHETAFATREQYAEHLESQHSKLLCKWPGCFVVLATKNSFSRHTKRCRHGQAALEQDHVPCCFGCESHGRTPMFSSPGRFWEHMRKCHNLTFDDVGAPEYAAVHEHLVSAYKTMASRVSSRYEDYIACVQVGRKSKFMCTFTGCGKEFRRRDLMMLHAKRVHVDFLRCFANPSACSGSTYFRDYGELALHVRRCCGRAERKSHKPANTSAPEPEPVVPMIPKHLQLDNAPAFGAVLLPSLSQPEEF